MLLFTLMLFVVVIGRRGSGKGRAKEKRMEWKDLVVETRGNYDCHVKGGVVGCDGIARPRQARHGGFIHIVLQGTNKEE